MDARNHRVSVAADERGGEGGEGNRRVTATGRRWRLRGRFPEGELEGAPYPTLVRHLLWHRGLRSVDAARRFMDGTPAEYDPLLLPDIEAALARLGQAAQAGERGAVYGRFE